MSGTLSVCAAADEAESFASEPAEALCPAGASLPLPEADVDFFTIDSTSNVFATAAAKGRLIKVPIFNNSPVAWETVTRQEAFLPLTVLTVIVACPSCRAVSFPPETVTMLSLLVDHVRFLLPA